MKKWGKEQVMELEKNVSSCSPVCTNVYVLLLYQKL